MRVVFMGTPDIARLCLEKILNDGFQVVGVYTQPDRPKGRGMKLVASPVKELALQHNIPVFQPENFREEETVRQLADLQPDVVAVVAYGRILPQKVLDLVPQGFINIHASVLPQYRGSAPYQWAVLNGDRETGVSAQFMVHAMDAGDVVGVAKTPIGPNETAGELLDRLAVLGAQLLSDTLRSYEAGSLVAVPQDEKQIHATEIVSGKGTPGTILGLTKTGLVVACGEGAVEIRSLQADGGKRMNAPDYFRGHPLEV